MKPLKSIVILLILAGLFLIGGCGTNDDPTAPPKPGNLMGTIQVLNGDTPIEVEGLELSVTSSPIPRFTATATISKCLGKNVYAYEIKEVPAGRLDVQVCLNYNGDPTVLYKDQVRITSEKTLVHDIQFTLP